MKGINVVLLVIFFALVAMVVDLMVDNSMLSTDKHFLKESVAIQTTLATDNIEIALRYIHSVKDRTAYLDAVKAHADQVYASSDKKK